SASSRGRAVAWLWLGVLLLTLSTCFALVLAAARTPGLHLPALAGFFDTALVLHVNLSVSAWFLAFAALLWSLAGGDRHAVLDWLALLSMAAGALLLATSPWTAPGEAILSDYLPTLRSPLFFAGCLLLGGGAGLAALRLLLTTPPFARTRLPGGVGASGLHAAAICVLTALAAFAVTWWRLPLKLTGRAYYDPLYWAGGHLLQFAHLTLMLTVWLAMARRLGIGREWLFGPRFAWLLWLGGVIPALLTLFPGLALAPESPEQRHFFTALMRWGSWPVATLLAAGLAFASARPPEEPRGHVGAALWGSLLLMIAGIVAGVAIRGDTVMVTAHYHGTVGAVTLAYMGMTLLLLPALGGTAGPMTASRWQPRFYAGGLFLLMTGLAWSGMHGALRKTPMTAHLPEPAHTREGMILMGVGAAIALLATFRFLWPALRALLTCRSDAKTRAGRQALVLAGVLLIGGMGWLIHNAPGPEPRPALSPHQEALTRRFEEGAIMLHAKRYEYAVTAFHWVLQRAPEIPEAHVNMGFALLGLERPEAARDFFRAAISLRPDQANAFYGLAEANAATGAMQEARDAMWEFIRMTPPGSPFLERAHTLLMSWGEKPESIQAAPLTAPAR
ncbi:MAG: hypothetical protein HQM03_14750, partial [Magnetococcales bacterium]|nr:hypothetical protein [Magnetococcales bacterium]